MAAETQTLNFGPEWLRALSSGGSVTSPPLSPALPKYKLADYRYGREEMLALFLKDNKIPSDLLDKEFLPILQEEPLPPLALVPFTEEEQRNFSMSVNSAAVLRLTGRGGGTVVGAPRGRSSSRGRGRGRGESGFYQRSFDEVEGGFGRGGGREMHRSQSWEERGDRRFEKPGRKDPVRPNFEEGGTATTGRKHEFIRSESENWRIFREEQNGEDDDGGWRLAGSRRDGERWRPHSPDGPRSAGWREHMERRRRFEFDFRERDDERGYRRVRCGSGSMDDDRDSLPEWCLEDAEEEMGTFDSSGAFLSLKKVQKEPIPEEQEMDFRPVEEGEERSDSEGSHNEEAKDHEKTTKKEGEKTERVVAEAVEEAVRTSSPAARSDTPPKSQPQDPLQTSLFERKEESVPERIEKTEDKENRTENTPPAKMSNRGEDLASVAQPLPQISPDTASPAHLSPPVSNSNPAVRPVQTPVTAAPGMGNIPTDPDDEEGLKHLEQQAEKMVAYLQDSALDDERLAAKIQEHRAKGSSMPLFHEAMQKWYYKDPQGEIQGPFSNQEMAEWFQAGYFTMSLLVKRACDETFQPLGDIMKMWGRVPFTPGPAPLPHLGELDQERLTRQQELALIQMQHLQYQHLLIQQQYAQVLAQQQKAALSSQQQQQLAILLQQFQALKIRISEQNMMPPVTRSVSVPDTGSIWELQSASQPTVWEGSSVWDLPIDTAAQGPALEQLQQLEKAKAAKEEALRRQREQEIALRRQREEEERQQQEEALRRLEERRREEEERRQREELLRKQEEEAAKWAREEEEAQRRLEESRLRMEEEAARQRLEEEERKRKELELQRQKEIMRQRQQQQEALRRLQQQQQQQQLAQMKLPSSSTWGQQSNSGACQSQTTLSLAEIQKLEEERERQLREEQRRQQRELMKALQQQQQQQQQKLSGWGNVTKPTGTTKSLLEIQQEEARQMQKQQQQQHQQPNRVRNTTHSNLHTSIGNSVWGSLNTNPSNQWASDLVSSIWSNADTKNSNMGFWDDAVKEVGPRNSTNKNKSNASLSKSVGITSRQNKKVEEEEKLLKLFQGVNKAQDGFTQWCEQMLHALNTANNLDVPTFVSFLKEVESPYEVHDYIRAYLGDTPEAKEFAKQFLERRAKQKASQQRQQQQQQDSVWGMNHSSLHSVFQTNQSNNQQSNFEAVQSGKKKKKQKMVRADPSLLGFSVNASSERLNMGEIETLEDY
ncbi:GRB10-interacting GYF protein 2 isoform X8 [Apteryx mantelli]|uniref:GRB10-interacting GYF protein 2 isoform X8 n=1 Tax=Apteryx mantelli TaxID=2696672 RepID=A0A8B7IIL5_9AVES|nr:PREDICTED: PERQ amino acid-rich with GYF domain-containing protein 2 isoform X3 [Apteryx mantelli mantelli]XP_025935900.1 GRB10-interacting GYF protein 2 isoform X10 [Apteryx rowi]